MEDTAPEPSFDVRDAFAFLRRRRVGIALVATLLGAGTVLVALLWPPTYRSTATILVEEQEIPQDLVRTTVTSYADQRIQVIGQQVMTRANLLEIVEKYDLYAKRRKTQTNEEILERLRRDVKVDVLSADVAGGRRVTIAFTLSCDGETPERAQKVANELVTLYLNENLKIRQQKAADTTSFLSVEAQRLEQHIGDVEAKLAEFKRRNMGQLPELAQLNMQLRDKADADVADLDREMHLLEERRFYLQSQFDQTKPNTPVISATGERVILSPEDRLKTLKAQHAGMSGNYSADHPDMVRARREMQALEKEVGGAAGDDERAKQIEKLESEAVVLRERYSENHPDVVRLRKSIAVLKEGKEADSAAATGKPPKADNPGYLSLETQLKVLETEMESLQAKRKTLSGKLASYEARLMQTPQVEQEYLDMTRDRENSLSRYREMKAKLMEAEVAQELEKDRKGERFSLIDPPQFPERPRSPNRPAILLVGLVAALGMGMGYGGAAEAIDPSIKSAKQLGRIFGAPILSVIPHIQTAEDRSKQKHKRLVSWAVIAVGIVAAAFLLHRFYMPLEVLWYLILRRLGIAG